MNPQISISAVEASQAQVVVQEIPEVPVVEWIQEQIVETIEVIPQEQIEVQIGDILVLQEQLIAEVTTLNTSSTSTSSATPMAAVTTGVKQSLDDSNCLKSMTHHAAGISSQIAGRPQHSKIHHGQRFP